MALTPIEWIVTIFAVLGLIKLIVISVNKRGWWPVVKGYWSNPETSGFLTLILAAIVLWVLLQEMTIVQIMAASVFIALFMALGMLQFSNEIMGLAKKIMNKKFGWWLWVYIIIWAVLLLWALYEIFF